MFLDDLESEYFKKLFNAEGKHILDSYNEMTFTELESNLKNVYLYCNPWEGTDQAKSYAPYPSFLESVKKWAGDNFYRQQKASIMYLEVLSWSEDSQSVKPPESVNTHSSVCTGCTVCNSDEFEEWLSLFVED